MKITLHRPIWIDAETGVRNGNFDLADERRAAQLIARGYASDGFNVKAKAGAPQNKAMHAADVATRNTDPARVRTATTRELSLKPQETRSTADAAATRTVAQPAKKAAKKATKKATKRGR